MRSQLPFSKIFPPLFSSRIFILFFPSNTFFSFVSHLFSPFLPLSYSFLRPFYKLIIINSSTSMLTYLLSHFFFLRSYFHRRGFLWFFLQPSGFFFPFFLVREGWNRNSKSFVIHAAFFERNDFAMQNPMNLILESKVYRNANKPGNKVLRFSP